MGAENNLRFALWGSTIVALILAAFKPSLIWVAAPLLGIALSYTLLRLFVYWPPENHLGVIYRFGRFSRWVDPDRWEVVIPGIDQIMPPIPLDVRQVLVEFAALLTWDLAPMECVLLAEYQPDLREADPRFLSQLLRSPRSRWDKIIRTRLQEVAGAVINRMPFYYLLSPEGRLHLQRALSSELAQRVCRLGLLVGPERGVSVQVLRPADEVLRTLVEQFVAAAQGGAALDRVLPILEALKQRWPGVGWETLFLQWASAVAKDGAQAVPSVAIGPGTRVVPGAPPSRDTREPIAHPEARVDAQYRDGEQELEESRKDAQTPNGTPEVGKPREDELQRP